MRCSFPYGLKKTLAATGVSCLIAGGVSAMTQPSATTNGQTVTFSINRALKGDRLPQAKIRKDASNRSSPAMLTAPREPPIGCDPAFSAVADPARAHIFRRCMT
jgi:hypothetical protein